MSEERFQGNEEFRAAVTDVRPLAAPPQPACDPPKPPPVARFTHADAASVL
jgi:hypothetical protein